MPTTHQVPRYWRHMTADQKLRLAADVAAHTLNIYYDAAIDGMNELDMPNEPSTESTESSPTGVSSALQALDGNVPSQPCSNTSPVPRPRTQDQGNYCPMTAEERNFLWARLRDMSGSERDSVRKAPTSVPAYHIPPNPHAPKTGEGKSEYNLRTYEEYRQRSLAGFERKKLYPAAPGSTLATCNHCKTPELVLQNQILCPYHAYYAHTGKFLAYYQLCALVAMERQQLSVIHDWWTMEEMVAFLPMLSRQLSHRFLLANSDIIKPGTSWSTRASPFGPIGSRRPAKLQNGGVYEPDKPTHAWKPEAEAGECGYGLRIKTVS